MDTTKRFFLSFILIFFSLSGVFALPFGFRKISLGISVDELKDSLKKDAEFGYRGDRDVSLSPGDGQVIVETDGSQNPYSFLGRCWFQFADEKLYIITVNLNQNRLDHYSVFSTLCEKYGNPVEISPQKSVWKDDSVIMSLEKPLALKYVDAKAFESKQKKSNVDKTVSEQTRDSFLKGL